jgi:hypothetical protein
MKETTELHESPEKQITKTPEKKIDTFDDLRTSDKNPRIDTFDDIRKQGSDKSIRTFDDIREKREPQNRKEKGDVTGNKVKDATASIEEKRIQRAGEDIKKNDSMKPEKWKTLSTDEKRIALEHSGKAMGRAYDHPDPPLTTEKMNNPEELGSYGDGYSYDARTDQVKGSDYGISMNKDGVDYEKQKKLFGDDPKVALETHAHEFRHSYQNEQAHSYDKGFKVDDPEKAREWSNNLKDYKEPPDPELAKKDPEQYHKEYESYRNQSVERDAREFGSRVSSEVYKEPHEVKER